MSGIDPLSIFDEPAYDAADNTTVNIARQQATRDEADDREVIVAMMDQEKCRKWLYDLLVRCNIFTTPYTAGDPYQTTFNAGCQYIGQMILADIVKHAEEQYVHMCREGREREVSNMNAIMRAKAKEQ